MKLFKVLLLSLLIISLSSCKSEVKKEKVEEIKKEVSCADVTWSNKKDDNGPEHWKDLCNGFADCGGKVQSPIDIKTADLNTDNNLKAPVFDYGTSGVDIVNNSHTIQFNINGNNTVTLDNKTYKLLQFHYHAVSEHTIDGKHFPLEVHFVHKYSDTDFAVLGIMFKEGKKNDLLDKYLKHFPAKKGNYSSDDSIDLMSLFPADKSYYNYNGSLTTPPCSEVVNWYVLKTPVEASKEQLEQFATILNGNHRPIMSLNGRTVGFFAN